MNWSLSPDLTPYAIVALWAIVVALTIVAKHAKYLWYALRHDWWTFKASVGLCNKKEAEWAQECLKWRGEVLTGKFAHYCMDWDGLPMDETCENEWDTCHCFDSEGGY